MKYIKLYDRNYNILDEIYEFTSLNHAFTLNALGSCSFDIPLSSPKYTQTNFSIMNCVEIWQDSTCIWWGVIAYAVPKNSLLNVMCYGYLYIWQNIASEIGSFQNVTVADALQTTVNDVNSKIERSFFLGHTEENTLNLGQYDTANMDYYKKVQDLCDKYNLDFDIDKDFKFNYYLRKGSDKPYYSINYGTSADNCTGDPSYDISTSGMANYLVYNDGTYRYVAQDTISQALYGMLGAISSVNLQNATELDIQNAVNAELQRVAYPQVSVKCDIVDSYLCPLNNIIEGDRILVNFPTYGFKELLRIVELSFDDMTGKCNVSMGNVVYKPQKFQKKLYVR